MFPPVVRTTTPVVVKSNDAPIRAPVLPGGVMVVMVEVPLKITMGVVGATVEAEATVATVPATIFVKVFRPPIV